MNRIPIYGDSSPGPLVYGLESYRFFDVPLIAESLAVNSRNP